MTKRQRIRLAVIPVVVAAVCTLLLLGLLSGPTPVRADPGTLYVAPDGNDANNCSSYANRCRTVQRAVDVAIAGDEIRVAGGTYTGVLTRDGETQIVYITKTVTIRGGYNAGFSVWDPDTYATTLDAQGLGRVVFAIGPFITPTLEALQLTIGWSSENGGGIYADTAHLVISGCQVYSNTADDHGGGIYLKNSAHTILTANNIYHNTAGSSGGGICISSHSQYVQLTGNEVHNNTADDGGGLCFQDSHTATLTSNLIHDNRATSAYGGIALRSSDHAQLIDNEIYNNVAQSSGGGVGMNSADYATLSGNQIYSNTATATGGGIIVDNSSYATLSANEIYSNAAQSVGGGIDINFAQHTTLASNRIHHNRSEGSGGGCSIRLSRPVTLTNNFVTENQGSPHGAGIFVLDSDAHLLHTTIARNSGAGGQGIVVWKTTASSAVSLTNTILVSHTVGIQTFNGATAILTATLWGDGAWANGDDTIGSSIITGTLNWWEDPSFVYPEGSDYHIGADSDARDVGVGAGVAIDIDGDSRIYSGAPDLGADEYALCRTRLNDTPYPTVQDAADASTSPDDVVKVAGTCAGVQTRNSLDQLAYISKTLTLRGGYSLDFSAWDPELYPTTLDAQGEGRVIYISGQGIVGGITPTIEGLRLTHGFRSPGSGAGIFAAWAHPIISACRIFSNTAQFGGGGIYLTNGDNARLVGNEIYNNMVGWYGGGVYINTTGDYATLTGNEIVSNTATQHGGGLYISADDATLVNNIIADNHTTGSNNGAGVYLSSAARTRFLHTTLAHNRGGNGQGIYLTSSSLWMTNTILVSHTVGIQTSGSTAYLEATLWGDGPWANEDDVQGSNIFTGTVNVRGDPDFVDPHGIYNRTDLGNYHIRAGSAAIGQAVPTFATLDIDGEPRVGAPDLGADEFVLSAYLPLVLRNF